MKLDDKILNNFGINLTVENNNNFESVELSSMELSLSDVLRACHSAHFDADRIDRYEFAIFANKYEDTGKDAKIDKVFLVDKGHKAGKELHCVTKRGIIFILNERKYLNGEPALITIQIARPNQYARLYKAVGLPINQKTLDLCRSFENKGYNK